MANTLGKINPFRYRGYVFDEETGLYYLQSRYYDPHVGRFINMDSRSDNRAGVLSNNLFLYVANNPIIQTDPSGHGILKNLIKWVADRIAKPITKAIKKTLARINLTYSRGINVSGSPSIFSFNLQMGITIDTKGNVAVQSSYAGGVMTGDPSASVTLYQTITNAPSVKKLSEDNLAYQVGGTAGVPVYGVPLAFGGDLVVIPDTNESRTYYGGTANVGFGSPGGEFHIEWGKTVSLQNNEYNIFDDLEKIYQVIMGW